MSDIPIVIKREDEIVKFFSDDDLIVSVNHDEHGWAGMFVVEDAIKKICDRYRIRIIEE